jgi:hypothetical protein
MLEKVAESSAPVNEAAPVNEVVIDHVLPAARAAIKQELHQNKDCTKSKTGPNEITHEGARHVVLQDLGPACDR